jgi:hypothetical protein
MALVAWAIYDDTGAPRTGALGLITLVDYRDRSGNPRVQPTLLDLGGGSYGILPTATDELVGTCYLVDFGVGSNPRRVSGAITNGQPPFSVWHLEDATGALWTGAAPTIQAGNYASASGPLTSPGVVTVASTTYLFSVTPTTADATAGVSFRADSAAGAEPAYVQDVLNLAAVSPSPPPAPTADVTPENPPTPAADEARLISVSGDRDPHIDNGVQEVDVRLALQRGLAQYLRRLSLNALGGRRVRLRRVREEWSEPEENAEYPSAAVTLSGPGTYAPRALTPALNPKQRLPPPDNRYLIIPSEFNSNLAVEVWTTDPEERTALVQMLEAAFNPVPWRSGFVLELPFYFNVRATYVLKELSIPDDADDALRRYRRAIFTLDASAPLVTLFSFPNARPRFDLQAVGTDIDVSVVGSTSAS